MTPGPGPPTPGPGSSNREAGGKLWPDGEMQPLAVMATTATKVRSLVTFMSSPWRFAGQFGSLGQPKTVVQRRSNHESGSPIRLKLHAMSPAAIADREFGPRGALRVVSWLDGVEATAIATADHDWP